MRKSLYFLSTFLLFAYTMTSSYGQSADSYFSVRLKPEIFMGFSYGLPYSASGNYYDYIYGVYNQNNAQVGDVFTNKYTYLENEVVINSRQFRLGISFSTLPREGFSLKMGIGIERLFQLLTKERTDTISIVPFAQYTVISTGTRPVLDYKKLVDFSVFDSDEDYFHAETFGVQYLILPLTIKYAVMKNVGVELNLTPQILLISNLNQKIGTDKNPFSPLYITSALGLSYNLTRRTTISSCFRISLFNVLDFDYNRNREYPFYGVGTFMPSSFDITVTRSFSKRVRKEK